MIRKIKQKFFTGMIVYFTFWQLIYEEFTIDICYSVNGVFI